MYYRKIPKNSGSRAVSRQVVPGENTGNRLIRYGDKQKEHGKVRKIPNAMAVNVELLYY